MGVLVIIIVTIPKSFHIVIHHKSNFILELFFIVCLAPMFLFVCIFLFFLHPFNFLFILSICILLWTYLLNQTFVNILPTKSRMKKYINGTKWHRLKFIKLYLLKRKNWLEQNYYVHKKIIPLSLVVWNNMAPKS
jgi:hypothetical protein